jgi:hypothetical protein
VCPPPQAEQALQAEHANLLIDDLIFDDGFFAWLSTDLEIE